MPCQQSYFLGANVLLKRQEANMTADMQNSVSFTQEHNEIIESFVLKRAHFRKNENSILLQGSGFMGLQYQSFSFQDYPLTVSSVQRCSTSLKRYKVTNKKLKFCN